MPYQQRYEKLKEVLLAHHIHVLALVPGANLRYVSNATFHPSERLTLALFPVYHNDIAPCIVLPALEQARIAQTAGIAFEYFPWDDAEGYEQALQQAVAYMTQKLSLAGDTAPMIGIEHMMMRVMELYALQQAWQHIQTTDATNLLGTLRMAKDATELATMKEAVRIVETALQELLPLIKPGMTERHLAHAWSTAIKAHGAEQESFAAIVASGANSANPHHVPGDRAFEQGDLIILDGGAMFHGYASDITRTVALGEPSNAVCHIYQLVQAANQAARDALTPGITGEQIDRAARQVIAEGGYGDYFVHRTGHGLGLEVHELPFLVAGSNDPLPVGTTCTIEPGIYVDGVGGVRIEDDVVITADGGESLTSFERDLIVL